MSGAIDLLRHGETTVGSCYLGSLDAPLTAAGAAAMSAVLTDHGPWEVVVTSPLARCAAPARALAERTEAELWVEPDLREIHFGEWEGRCAEQLMREDGDRLTRFWADPITVAPPGGEPFPEFRARVLGCWRGLMARQAGRRLLLVTHGGVIRVVAAALLRLSLPELLAFSVPHAALWRALPARRALRRITP